MAAKSAPPLNAPASTATVKVHAIDTTLHMSPSIYNQMWSPQLKGWTGSFGAWSFLIEHPSGRKLLYDLGMRKDWDNLAPSQNMGEMSKLMVEFEIKDDVAGILTKSGVDLKGVEAIIWSHWYMLLDMVRHWEILIWFSGTWIIQAILLPSPAVPS